MTPIILTPSSPATTDEAWVLDGLDFNSTPWRVERLTRTLPAQRQTWLESPDEDGALLLEDPKVGNAELVFRMRLSQAATDMDAALNFIKDLELKLSECSATRGGIDLVWTPKSSTHSATIKALAGEITELPITNRDDDLGWFIRRPVLTFKLTTEPYGELDEVTGPTVTTTDPVALLVADAVPGTAPARPRLVVTDTAGVARRHLEIGIETNRSYDFADGDLFIDVSGSPVDVVSQSVQIYDTGDLAHVGSFRIKARVEASAATVGTTWVRLSWQEGDGPFRSNDWVTPPVTTTESEVDLGTIIIPPSRQGAQKWSGSVEAYSAGGASTDQITLVHLILVPTSVRYGKGRPLVGGLETPTAFSAFDGFDQSAGDLDGLTLPLGGTWATSGDATDLAVEASGHTVQRSATADALGRTALAGAATFSDVVAQMDFKVSALAPADILQVKLILRYADSSNFMEAVIWPSASNLGCVLQLQTIIGGFITTIAQVTLPALATARWYTWRALVDSRGRAMAALALQGQTPTTWSIQTSDPAFATGGALESGQVGFSDKNSSATALTRNYDNFAAWEPEPADAVIFADRSAEITHKASLRENAAGTYWGQIAPWRGRFLTIPPAGDKDLSTRLLVKARANDVDIEADDSTYEEITATLYYTPTVKVVP